MSTMSRNVTLTEVGPRDGLQSEKVFVPTERKIGFVNQLQAAGLKRIEVTSFVSPHAVPQLADAVEVMAGIERRDGARFAALVPNARGAAMAVEAGVNDITVFVSASESHNRTNLNCSPDESLRKFEQVAEIVAKAGRTLHAAIAVSFGCPFEGEVAPEAVLDRARRMHQLGAQTVTLGDTTGMATPAVVERVVSLLQAELPQVEPVMHFHNTRGLGLVNVVKALELGITRYESAFGGLGGCPFAPGATGNIATEDLVNMLTEMGIGHGVDLEALCRVSLSAEEFFDRKLPAQVMHAGSRLKLYPMESVRRAVG